MAYSACPEESGKIINYRVKVEGIVQGVGFRPFVFNLAYKYGLKGWVLNSVTGVTLEIEGEKAVVAAFLKELEYNPPRLARITSISFTLQDLKGYESFEIIKSDCKGEKEVLISPDVAICDDCRQDILNPLERRFHYPFTNCTNCGPRFTIIRDLPYDRERTSMSAFPMCRECKQEYNDPGNRRFHAQPNACPECGPSVSLVDRNGKEVSGNWAERFRQFILAGKIIAVKGLGGFHLACDARNALAVQELRQRKRRPAKPLAIMCRDLDTVKKYCLVSSQEAQVLLSPAAPIVVLERRPGSPLPDNLAPNLKSLGVMLPYTPLHLLLFDGEVEALVMTSGNLSGQPLVKDNNEALARLKEVADYFLLHNRGIENRCDDSVVKVVDGELQFWRRSRGYAPAPVEIPVPSKELSVLGTGGEMKNTFCLVKGNQAFLSQHIGEMSSEECAAAFHESLDSLSRLLNITPQVIACDLHPNYRISRLARELPAEQLIAVQHHHAHLASCMADNGLQEEVIGIICDGTGYGTDGCIWGLEILRGDFCTFRREIHLDYVPMPGGEMAVRQPFRMALAYLYRYFGEAGMERYRKFIPCSEQEIEMVSKLLQSKFNSPLTSSCGRFFDVVAALLLNCRENTYEGQAAVDLAELVHGGYSESYPFEMQEGVFYPAGVLAGILRDLKRGTDKALIATKFHNTLVEMVCKGVAEVRARSGLNKVVLSGGTWQNPYLLVMTRRKLKELGFDVYCHRLVPTNDGGLALGQAAIACWRSVTCV
jgi:hydrogenase maturation protein HypF